LSSTTFNDEPGFQPEVLNGTTIRKLAGDASAARKR